MMKRMFMYAAVAGLFLALAPAAQAELYHWVFVTSTARDATSPDIADYDAHVQAAADAGSETSPLALSWKAIASTDTVDASAHVNVQGPVYLLDGTLVADDAVHLWGTGGGNYGDPTNLHWGITRTEYGVDLPNDYLPVWTGTNPDGTKGNGTYDGEAGFPLGHLTDEWPMYGDINGWERRWNCHWIAEWDDINPSNNLPLYAISEPIPEPATMALLAFGGLGVLLRRKRR